MPHISAGNDFQRPCDISFYFAVALSYPLRTPMSRGRAEYQKLGQNFVNFAETTTGSVKVNPFSPKNNKMYLLGCLESL